MLGEFWYNGMEAFVPWLGYHHRGVLVQWRFVWYEGLYHVKGGLVQ